MKNFVFSKTEKRKTAGGYHVQACVYGFVKYCL